MAYLDRRTLAWLSSSPKSSTSGLPAAASSDRSTAALPATITHPTTAYSQILPRSAAARAAKTGSSSMLDVTGSDSSGMCTCTWGGGGRRASAFTPEAAEWILCSSSNHEKSLTTCRVEGWKPGTLCGSKRGRWPMAHATTSSMPALSVTPTRPVASQRPHRHAHRHAHPHSHSQTHRDSRRRSSPLEPTPLCAYCRSSGSHA